MYVVCVFCVSFALSIVMMSETQHDHTEGLPTCLRSNPWSWTWEPETLLDLLRLWRTFTRYLSLRLELRLTISFRDTLPATLKVTTSYDQANKI